jgi:hypothetical protein
LFILSSVEEHVASIFRAVLLRCNQHVRTKRRYASTRLHGVTTQNTSLCIYLSRPPIACYCIFLSLITLRIFSDWIDWGLIPGGGKKYFSSSVSRPAPGSTQSPIQWVPGVKRPGHEADHSPAPPAEVKNGRDISLLSCTFSWCDA